MIKSKNCPRGILRIFLAILVSGSLPAAIILPTEVVLDTTAGWDSSLNSSFVGALGGGGGPGSMGQTFTAPQQSRLVSFSVFVDEFDRDLPVKVIGRVTPWVHEFAHNTYHYGAIGPVLFESAVVTTDGTRGTLQELKFDTGGLDLVAGNAYIFFVSAYRDLNPNQTANLRVGYTGELNNPYSEGEFRYAGSYGSTLESDLSTNWTALGDLRLGQSDLAFRAVFTSIPEPGSSFLLLLAGMAGWRARLRRY